MEKIIIKSVIDTGRKAKTGAAIIEIHDELNRKIAFFDDKVKEFKEGQEIECELKDNGEYQGIRQYIGNLPKPASQSGGNFPKKDWSYEKRRASLEFSIKMHEGIGISMNDVLQTAEKLYQYLNK